MKQTFKVWNQVCFTASIKTLELHQNLIPPVLAQVPPVHQILGKSVEDLS